MPNDERILTEREEGLIRRAYSRGKPKAVIDQISGAHRAPAAAFEPRFPDPSKPNRKVDKGLSVNIESSLRGAGQSLSWGVNPKEQYAARITVGDCLDNQLEAVRDPTEDNPHHGQILGLVEMFTSDSMKYEVALDNLARASRVVEGGA